MARKEKVTKVIDGDTFETASRKNEKQEKTRQQGHERTAGIVPLGK
jgi:endonuclease YncB( thermonuclease family)